MSESTASQAITPRRPPRILLGVCGGIAAYKSAEIVRRLRDRGCAVRCALTRSAKSFVQPLTLEVLTEHAVYEQEYLTATGRGEESHIAAAQWADLLLVAPATAHVMARLAYGLADDFLSTTALAVRGPVLLAPAMHHDMWHHPAVESNARLLVERGVELIGPVEGALASGERGWGRLADPLDIVDAVMARLADPSEHGALAGRSVVISAGPTHEPIDPVRFLGNRSSGKMGFALAAEAAKRGARVTLIAGPVHLPTPPGVARVDVGTALEMRSAVHAAASTADLVVMTAVVADFRPAEPGARKIKKEDGVPEIVLTRNPDILTELADIAPRALRVGFAAETEASLDEARAKLARKRADFLIWNDVSRTDIGFGSDHNAVTVHRAARGGDAPSSVEPSPVELARDTKARLAARLIDLFAEALAEREPEEHASAAAPLG